MILNNSRFSLTTILILSLLITNDSWSQQFPRLANPQYTQLKLMEEFDDSVLNRETWQVSSQIQKDDLYIFADTASTIKQSNGSLELSMHRHPSFTTTTWSPSGDSVISADFIGAEIMSRDDYSYGIFECSVTLAGGGGSFPAFWLYNDTMCFESARPEIDIAELKVNHRNPTLDNNIWYYPAECLPQTSHEFTQHTFDWGGTHVFKCVWTPEKIEFYADGKLLKEVHNTGQYWFPRLEQHVMLSQQITRYGRMSSDTAGIVTPQTSRFHWVRVREFFPAPEINIPGDIRKTATARLDVDSAASDITWELTPESLFSGRTNGRGSEAVITPASGYHGKGKIYFRFKMPSGETYYVDKIISLNGLHMK